MRPAVHVFQFFATAGIDGVWWRFLSPNGRGLARSPQGYPTLDDASTGLSQAIAVLPDTSVIVRPTPDNRWRWRLDLDGEPLVLGAGAQDRRVRCEAACQRFVDSAPDGFVDPVVHTFRRVDAGYPRMAIS